MVDALAGLIGTWTGSGTGQYPTIAPFGYVETVTFGSITGKPFVTYTQRTSDPTTNAPMHSESGYLRHPAVGQIELVVSQPTGVTEVHTGTITTHGTTHGTTDSTTTVLTLRAMSVACTPTAKEVTAVERTWRLRGDLLSYEVSMAAVGQPLTLHLQTTLERTVTS